MREEAHGGWMTDSHMKQYLDFESRSAVHLKRVGAWTYALHPSTEIMCFTLGPSRERLQSFGAWDLGWDWKKLTIPGLEQDFIVSHGPFEYIMYNLILHRRFGWPARWDPKLWGCTLSRAAQAGLPLDLESLGRVLQFKTPKDLEGRRVMHQVCKPIEIDALGDPVFDNDPVKFKRLLAYNRVDVLAEIEGDEQLPELVPHERAIWEMDLVMNRRGIQVDLDLAAKASKLSGRLVEDLNARLLKMTGGAVTKASRIAEIKQYLLAHGVAIPTKPGDPGALGEDKETLDKAAVLDLLGQKDLPRAVRDVIEVRQQVGKSTSTAKYTKALEMVCPDGRVRGASQYHAAHTGRDGGRLLQLQNFPKGFKAKDQAEAVALILKGDAAAFVARYGVKGMSTLSDALRALVVAASGKVLVRADYNSIELCVEMWLADDKAVLAQLRRGEKPYVDLARDIYGNPKIQKPTDDDGTYAAEYDLGKRAVLGCFSPDTVVLTSNGWKTIIEVTSRDRVWDGIEWVKHDGVIDQGEQATIRFAGIGVTPDHLFLTPDGKWVSASQVRAAGAAYLRSMTATVVSGLLVSNWVHEEECSVFVPDVPAGASRLRTSIICAAEQRRAAIGARNAPQFQPANGIGGTPRSARTMLTESDCSTGSRRQFNGATIPEIPVITIMAVEESRFGRLGEKTAAFFWLIFLRSAAGMTRLLSWIGSTIRKATGRKIFASPREPAITPIDGALPNSSSESLPSRRVYDVLNAGPRNRFTILTDEGPAIVHNCGYGMGASKFKLTCKVQANLDISDELAERAIKMYRMKYASVVRMWAEVEAAVIAAVKNPIACFPACGGKILWGMSKDRRFLVCRLPSGRFLWYWRPSVRVGKTPWGQEKEEMVYWGENPRTKEWCQLKTYGGALVENVTQAVARDMMFAGWMNVEKAGYPVLFKVHDELVAEVPVKAAGLAELGDDGMLKYFIEKMCALPDWAKGCPVAAEGWLGPRYRK